MKNVRRQTKLHERMAAVRLRTRFCRDQTRTCSWPGCEREGRYPAPRSRECLRDFIWMCLEHVREYNRSWDYFSGMSAEEIDAYRHEDLTWHRPTWRFGAGFDAAHSRFHDRFRMFEDEEENGRGRHRSGAVSVAVEMMQRLDLEPGFTLEELKRRYKELVKKHHPDLHGGDRAGEERLKLINEAYTYLLGRKLHV